MIALRFPRTFRFPECVMSHFWCACSECKPREKGWEHNNCLIQPWPSSCWPAHWMGIYSNPLINGLIQHTFKQIVFVQKFPVTPLGLDANCFCLSQVTTMFQWTPPPSPPSKKTKELLKTHWDYTRAEVRPRLRKRCNEYFTKTFFLLLLDLVHRRTAAPVAAENCR